MKKSIITDNIEECFICKGRATEIHHAMHGYGNRSLADKYGLVVGLCHNCHNEPPLGAHFNAETDLLIKQAAQRAFIKKYSAEKWQRLFMKNFL